MSNLCASSPPPPHHQLKGFSSSSVLSHLHSKKSEGASICVAFAKNRHKEHFNSSIIKMATIYSINWQEVPPFNYLAFVCFRSDMQFSIVLVETAECDGFMSESFQVVLLYNCLFLSLMIQCPIRCLLEIELKFPHMQRNPVFPDYTKTLPPCKPWRVEKLIWLHNNSKNRASSGVKDQIRLLTEYTPEVVTRVTWLGLKSVVINVMTSDLTWKKCADLWLELLCLKRRYFTQNLKFNTCYL